MSKKKEKKGDRGVVEQKWLGSIAVAKAISSYMGSNLKQEQKQQLAELRVQGCRSSNLA